MTLDDLPLSQSDDDVAAGVPSRSAPRSRVGVWVALATILAGAGAWYAWMPRRSPAGATDAATAASNAPADASSATAPRVALPPLGEMDPFVRSLLTPLSSSPALLAWLATDDLVGAIATAIDRLAGGHSPARDLAVLRPTAGFAVVRRDAVVRVDPATYARHAPLVAAVTAVDPARLAEAFHTLAPRLSEAYVAHGHPEGGFDQAVDRAIAMVAATPVVPADAALVPGVGGYAYADPTYESLPAAQKHLVRMGPDAVSRVVDAARRFGVALRAVREQSR